MNYLLIALAAVLAVGLFALKKWGEHAARNHQLKGERDEANEQVDQMRGPTATDDEFERAARVPDDERSS